MLKWANTKDLRQRNRALVLQRFVAEGESSRAEIAGATGLSAATVTNVVGDLTREGLIREVGVVPSDGGRPISRFGLAGDGAHMIGADIGEEGVTAELFDLTLQRVDRVFRGLRPERVSPEEIAAALLAAITELREAHPKRCESLIGIGLGLPGIVETGPDGVTTLYAQSLGWQAVAVDESFRDVRLPLYADNGAKTLTTAEHWFGAARGTTHAIVALIGRGVGTGVIANGSVMRGSSSSAGEWGHTKVSRGGPVCACGKRGCLEAYVGGGAILRRWREVGGSVEREDERALAQLLAELDEGDARAEKVIDETVEILGMGLANLVNLFNPEQIVIGGWAGQRLYRARAEELGRALREYSLDRPAEQVRLDACKLGDDAVALGAALLPLDRLIKGDLPAPKAAS